jgi:DNA-binding SARP family transcriptional activator/tetratricopeptide (TPR) repeat protein
VQFRVLGPVEIHTDDGRVLTPPRRHERCLLAILLLNAGRGVPIDRACELLWDDDPPDHAHKAVRTYIARIRSILNQAGADQYGVALTAGHGGYLLKSPPDLIDVHRFRALVDQATRTTDPAGRDQLLRDALGLWHGRALEKAATDRLRQRLCADLDELHQHAVDEALATGLDLGRHRDLLPELARLSSEQPVRERTVELHMLALHRDGRTAEALDVYQRARTRLADELGLDPSPALQGLHQAILRGERLSPPQAVPAAASVTPAQLPADVAGFVGRTDQLGQLDALFAAASADSVPVMVVSAIAGTAGVGKTALAVRWAHQVRDRFPDGQLYVDLRGYASEPPLTPLAALAGFLPALGVPVERVPADLNLAAGLYRSVLAGKRVLVLLDNAGSAEQVRPLLPATAGCTVLITSRDRLSGLIARDGAHRIAVDMLPADDAVDLLGRVVGPGRVAAERDAAFALADLCGHLPLALRIVAAHLVDRPGLLIASLVHQLRTGDRLSTLSSGDELTAVRTAFDLSYTALPADCQRLFRRLGLVPGPHVGAEAAAALTATTPDRAAGQLDRLAAAHLLIETAPGRYTCHDLLRCYAAERAHLDDDDAGRSAAVDRVYGYYLRTVDCAVDVFAAGLTRLPRPATDATDTELPTPRFDNPDQALAWLDVDRPNLVAAVTTAAEHGPYRAAWLLADALRGYLLQRILIVDWLAVAAAGLAAATAADDLHGQAAAELSLGHAYTRQDRHREAVAHAREALRLAGAAGWMAGECAARNNLGVIYVRTGELAKAADHLNAVLEIARSSATISPVQPLHNLGNVHYDRGDLANAVDLYLEAAKISQTTPTIAGQTLGPALLGRAYHALGRYVEARFQLNDALAAGRRFSDTWAESLALCWLALVDRDTGHPDQALCLARTALSHIDDSEASEHQSEIVNLIGTIHQHLGQQADALDCHRRALVVAREAEARRPELEALVGLATSHTRLHRLDLARSHAERAHALARRNGYRIVEADALAALAAIAVTDDEYHRAIDHAETALDLYRQTGHRLGQANAHLMLSQATQQIGEHRRARRHRQHADTILSDIGAPPGVPHLPPSRG